MSKVVYTPSTARYAVESLDDDYGVWEVETTFNDLEGAKDYANTWSRLQPNKCWRVIDNEED